MAEAKTKPTKQSVERFIKSVPDENTREDCATIAQLMREATRAEPQMWGRNIVGFGIREIQYAGGVPLNGRSLVSLRANRISPCRSASVFRIRR